ELEEHGGQGEDVGALVDGPSPGLFGRHVLQLALERAGLRVRGLRGRLGDAEVAELDVAVLGDEDVLRRDVAVHQAEVAVLEVALAMCVVERRGDFRGDEERQLHVQRVVAVRGASSAKGAVSGAACGKTGCETTTFSSAGGFVKVSFSVMYLPLGGVGCDDCVAGRGGGVGCGAAGRGTAVVPVCVAIDPGL